MAILGALHWHAASHLSIVGLGAVSDNAAVLWMMSVGEGWQIAVYTAEAGKEWRRSPSKAVMQRDLYMQTQTGRCVITGLRPATKYQYRVIFFRGHDRDTPHEPQTGQDEKLAQDVIERTGEFVTFVTMGRRSEFSFNFGSCLFASMVPMLSVGTLLHQPMAFFLLLGDAVYADPPFNLFTSFEMLYRYLVVDPMFAALTARTPLIGMFDDHEVRNNWDAGDQDPHFDSAIGNWTRFVGLRNPPPPPCVPRSAKFFMYQHGDVRFFVLDVRSYRTSNCAAASRSLLGPRQLACLRQFLFYDEGACEEQEAGGRVVESLGRTLESTHGGGDRAEGGEVSGAKEVEDDAGEAAAQGHMCAGQCADGREFPSYGNRGAVRLRVIVSPVPFSLNAGEGIPLGSCGMGSDGWRDFGEEREQVLEWMRQARQPVLLISGDLHWAAVFNGSGVVEVSASPIFQLPLAAWETRERMSRRESTCFLSCFRLHFGRVHVDTREGAGVRGEGSVLLQIHQARWFGGPSRILWSQRYDLADLVPRTAGV